MDEAGPSWVSPKQRLKAAAEPDSVQGPERSTETYRRWLTTGDLARLLERTPRGARWIADQEHLTCERTSSGVRLFHWLEVKHLAERRAEARLRNVRAMRPKKVGVPGEPHQLWLNGFFGGRVLDFRPRKYCARISSENRVGRITQVMSTARAGKGRR